MKGQTQPTKLCPLCDGVLEPFGGTRTGVYCPACKYMKCEPTEAEKLIVAGERQAFVHMLRQVLKAGEKGIIPVALIENCIHKLETES